jgi:hypothetical protein
MSHPGDDTLDPDGTLAGAAAGDDELARSVDAVPASVISGDAEDEGPEPIDGAPA